MEILFLSAFPWIFIIDDPAIILTSARIISENEWETPRVPGKRGFQSSGLSQNDSGGDQNNPNFNEVEVEVKVEEKKSAWNSLFLPKNTESSRDFP